MKVAVLAGGRSPEREVSLRSGHLIQLALQSNGHDVVVVDPGEVPLVETLAEAAPDICYLSLHGKEGEDGTVQRLLELLGIAYTGTGPFDCEVAFDKVLAKEALTHGGVRTPAWAVVEDRALRDLGAGSSLAAVLDRVGLPCVVKPSRGGSAMGVGFVERSSDLPAAVMAALSFSGAAVVETRIEGTEVAIGLTGTPWEPLPLVEIVPKEGVYDYAARYTAGATEYFAPARLSQDVAAACTADAIRAAEILRLRDVTRVDVIVDAHGQPWVLEVNVAPGMTETSLVPMATQATGRTVGDVCDSIIRSALTR
ncbi:MAG: D-alanine--D-alanine ligase [Actinomycetota bacterium]